MLFLHYNIVSALQRLSKGARALFSSRREKENLSDPLSFDVYTEKRFFIGFSEKGKESVFSVLGYAFFR